MQPPPQMRHPVMSAPPVQFMKKRKSFLRTRPRNRFHLLAASDSQASLVSYQIKNKTHSKFRIRIENYQFD